jgi:dsRNA-specific ribonuclease
MEALEYVWRHADADSYTIAACERQNGGVVYTEQDAHLGFRAHVRSPGQLTSLEPELRSQWCPTSEIASCHVVAQALQHFCKLGLLTKEHKPIAEEQLGPSADEDEEHVITTSHEERQLWWPIEHGGEQHILPFSALHSVNLSVAGKFPDRMLLLRIKLVIGRHVGADYGILLAAPSADEEHHVYFGLSLEWCRGTEFHGVVRFMQEIVQWKAQCWKILAGEEAGMASHDQPEEVIREYHESMIHNRLPHTRPETELDTADYPKKSTRLPAAGLLVRLVSGSPGNEACFAWKEMKRVTEAERVRKQEITQERRNSVLKTLKTATEEEEECPLALAREEPKAAEEWPLALDGEDSDIFRASAKPPTQMDVADAPCWLLPVLHRWYRLHDFKMATLKHGPVFPVLSPLKLEAALTMPCTGLKDMPFEGYRAIGIKVLGLISAVTAHARMPGSQHQQILQMMVDMFPRERLAKLIWNGFPTGMLATAIAQLDIRLWAPQGTRVKQHHQHVCPKVPNKEELANIMEALVGAYFISEGTFFSVCQFLLWLQQQSGEEDNPKPWEKAVVGHLLFGSGNSYRGRTSSYIEFQEILVGDETILRVTYAGENKPYWIEYRRSGLGPNTRKFPEERRQGGTGKWQLLGYVQKCNSFVSREDYKTPVPNKMLNWLLGKSCCSLVNLKPISKQGKKKKTNGQTAESLQTPVYIELMEKRAGELWVNYKEHGWFIYKRSHDGSLGTELRQTSNKSCGSPGPSGLIYLEILGTLKSSILKMPLPNKVVSWILRHTCLARIIQPKACQLDVGTDIDDESKVVTNVDNLVVTWWYERHGCRRGFEFSVDVEPIEHGGGGEVMMEREITDAARPKDKEELIYSEAKKTWLSPSLTKAFHCMSGHTWCDGVPLHSEVAVWLCKKLQNPEPMLQRRSLREHCFKVPWCVLPKVDKNTMVPHRIALDAVEMLLPFTFTNQLLLTEALTHGSYDIAQTPPNTRLATLGRWLVETMLTTAIIQRIGFPMHTTHTTEDDVEAKEPSQTFAVSALLHSTDSKRERDYPLKWPRISSDTLANKWLTDGLHSKFSNTIIADSDRLLECVNSVCNHVTYAYVCCQMGLHNHILESSEELKSDMSDFAKIARLASHKPEMLWPTLSARDAPRALSDTLLAVAAAVFLDTNWINFHRLFGSVFKVHLLDKMFHDQMTSADGGITTSGDPVAHLQRLAGIAGLSMEVCPAEAALVAANTDLCRGRTFAKSGLSPDTSSTHPSVLRDVHVCSLWIEGIQIGPHVTAASPRSATRRCASLAAPGLTADSLSSLKTQLVQLQASPAMVSQKIVRNLLIQHGVLKEEVGTGQLIVHLPKELDSQLCGETVATSIPDIEPTLPDYGQGGTGTPADNDGVMCVPCSTWCNGPSQWEDHKIGQKHRKNTQGKPSQETNKGAGSAFITPSSQQQDIDFPTCTKTKRVSDDDNSWTTSHRAKGNKNCNATFSTDSTTKVVRVGCDDSGGTGSCCGGIVATMPLPPPAPQTMQQHRVHRYPNSDWSGYSSQWHGSYRCHPWPQNTHDNMDGGNTWSRTIWSEHDEAWW